MSKPDDITVDQAKEFYDDRYLKGYMSEWPAAKKQRVAELVRSLPLPKTGKVLDYGCGAGVFTEVLKASLPNWTVCGVELSDVALELARQRVKNCRFLTAAEIAGEAPFDLIFTHHVLEHVGSLHDVFEDMSRLSAPRGYMLHILPCGNAGSFEQRLASSRRNGIRTADGGQFYFEDPGHLRRVTSAELAAELEPFGFRLRASWFANQFWGSLDWITDLNRSFVWTVVNPSEAASVGARLRMSWWAVWMMALQAARHPPGAFPKFLAGPADNFLRARALAEWRTRQHDPAASEMYLLFQRGAE